MNVYRGAPQKAARRRFEFRARGSAVPLLCVIVFGAFASVFFVERVFVSCSRAANTCTYGEIGIGTPPRHTIPLATIGGLDVENVERGSATRLVFATASAHIPVTSSFDNAFDADRRRISTSFTRWIESRNESFDDGYGPSWAVVMVLVLGLVLAFLNLWRGGATATVVYDAVSDTAIITMRESALSRTQCAELREPRVRVWKRMIEIHDEHGNIVPLPARESDPQARGLSTVLARD